MRVALQLVCIAGITTIACSRPLTPSLVSSTGVTPIEQPFEIPARLDLRHVGPNTQTQQRLEQRIKCRAGSTVACRLAASLYDHADLERMAVPCANGDRYACRISTLFAMRDLQPSDCATGLAPISICPIVKTQRARAQPLLIDSCRQGVLADCIAVNDRLPATIPIHAPSAIVACHFSGVCYELVFHLLDRGAIGDARYYLELLCRAHNGCGLLEAAYRGGFIPELYPGRLRELPRTTPIPWMYTELEKRVKPRRHR